MKMGSSLLIPKTYLNEFLYASKYSNYNHTLLLVNLKLNVKYIGLKHKYIGTKYIHVI